MPHRLLLLLLTLMPLAGLLWLVAVCSQSLRMGLHKASCLHPFSSHRGVTVGGPAVAPQGARGQAQASSYQWRCRCTRLPSTSEGPETVSLHQLLLESRSALLFEGWDLIAWAELAGQAQLCCRVCRQ